jgi:hypothetical protein
MTIVIISVYGGFNNNNNNNNNNKSACVAASTIHRSQAPQEPYSYQKSTVETNGVYTGILDEKYEIYGLYYYASLINHQIQKGTALISTLAT